MRSLMGPNIIDFTELMRWGKKIANSQQPGAWGRALYCLPNRCVDLFRALLPAFSVGQIHGAKTSSGKVPLIAIFVVQQKG